MLTERKLRLEDNLAKLKVEQADLTAYLQSITVTDDQLADIEKFVNEIRSELKQITFENKRRVIEYLDVRATIAVEDGEKVVYVKCLVTADRLSIAGILPS